MGSKFNILFSARHRKKSNLMLASNIWGNPIAHPSLIVIQAILKIVCVLFLFNMRSKKDISQLVFLCAFICYRSNFPNFFQSFGKMEIFGE